MSFTETTNQQILDGGAGDSYVFTKFVAAQAELHVAILDVNEVPTELTHPTHYDVTGIGTTAATITYPKASGAVSPFDISLLATEKLVVWIAPVQDQDFKQSNNKPYIPSTLGIWMDQTRRMIQDMQEQMDRKLGITRGSTAVVGSLTLEDFVGQKVLLATGTASFSATVDLVSVNWPAFYDAVEIEVVGSFPNTDSAGLRAWIIDSGTPTAVNTYGQFQYMQAATPGSGTTTNGGFPVGPTQGDTLEEACNGSYMITHHGGFLGCVGQFSWRYNGDGFFSTMAGTLHTTAPTRHDGFSLRASAGTLEGGTYRLWGLPKA